MGRWSGSDDRYTVALTPGLVPGTFDFTDIEDATDVEVAEFIRAELRRGHEVRFITKPED